MKGGIYSLVFHGALLLLSRPIALSLEVQRPPPPLPLQVQLVSAAQAFERSEAGGGSRPPVGQGHERPVFPPEAVPDPSDAMQTGPTGEGGIRKVEAEGLPSPPQNRQPKNMNGPQDCLLKVIAQVCPLADLQCLADYHAFCATLPTPR